VFEFCPNFVFVIWRK